MEIVYKHLEELTPYENNPRKNDKAVEPTANSIREFGFKVPIVIDTDGVIVAGHTRYKAAKKLGLEEVPCIIASDLTEEQIAAFRLADNKVGEMATWDIGKLNLEMGMIASIDMGQFGFEFNPEMPGEEEPEEDGYYGDERERTFDGLRLNEYDSSRVAGMYDIPIIKATQFVPDQLMGFNYVLSDAGKSAAETGIHFFLDDYQFERIWRNPAEYIDRLRPYQCVLTPDFSLYMDMPKALMIYNVYRSHLIGQILQDAGLTVIPTIQYAGADTFSFAFDGIEPGGTIATSTVGVATDPEAIAVWTAGMDEAIKRLRPSTIVCYGSPIGYDWRDNNVVTIPARRWDKSHEDR